MMATWILDIRDETMILDFRLRYGWVMAVRYFYVNYPKIDINMFVIPVMME